MKRTLFGNPAIRALGTIAAAFGMSRSRKAEIEEFAEEIAPSHVNRHLRKEWTCIRCGDVFSPGLSPIMCNRCTRERAASIPDYYKHPEGYSIQAHVK